MTLFAIYANPSDYPERVVERRWDCDPDASEGLRPTPEPLAVTETLAEAREAVPHGLQCIPRLPGDDPVIVEVWM